MTVDEIINRIPDSWENFKLKDYKKVLNVNISEGDEMTEDLFVGAENALNCIAAITGASVEELEELPLHQIKKLAAKLSFISEPPEIKKKSVIQWKKLDEITYSDFTLYQTFANDIFNNMELIIKSFAKNDLTPEEILELDMVEVHTGFFLLKKECNRLLNRMTFYTAKTLAKQTVKEMLQHTRSKLNFRRKQER